MKDVLGPRAKMTDSAQVTKALAHSGLIRLNPDWDPDGDEDDEDDLDMMDTEKAEDFSAQMSVPDLEKFRLDLRDFPELKLHFNMNTD